MVGGWAMCEVFCCVCRAGAWPYLYLCASPERLVARPPLLPRSVPPSLPPSSLLPLPFRPTRRLAVRKASGKPAPFLLRVAFCPVSVVGTLMSACEGREERGQSRASYPPFPPLFLPSLPPSLASIIREGKVSVHFSSSEKHYKPFTHRLTLPLSLHSYENVLPSLISPPSPFRPTRRSRALNKGNGSPSRVAFSSLCASRSLISCRSVRGGRRDESGASHPSYHHSSLPPSLPPS